MLHSNPPWLSGSRSEHANFCNASTMFAGNPARVLDSSERAETRRRQIADRSEHCAASLVPGSVVLWLSFFFFFPVPQGTSRAGRPIRTRTARKSPVDQPPRFVSVGRKPG